MSEHSTSTPWLSGTTYEILKWVAAIGIPAFSALYFALSQVWGFGGAEKIIGTAAAINTFIGIVLGVSTKQYYNTAPYDGVLNVLNADDPSKNTVYDMVLDRDPETIASDKFVKFKVNNGK